MNALQIAALLAFILGLAHSVLGERYILTRLFRRAEHLPRIFGGTEFTTRTLRFAWHLTTVLFWTFAWLLWQAAANTVTQDSVLRVIGYACIAGGVLPLVMTRGRHLSWVVLFVIGGIALARAGA
jgi:hypothetical protein